MELGLQIKYCKQVFLYDFFWIFQIINTIYMMRRLRRSAIITTIKQLNVGNMTRGMTNNHYVKMKDIHFVAKCTQNTQINPKDST